MSDADRTNTLDLSSAERAEEANRINTLNLSPAEREARHDADVAYAAMGNGVGAMAMVDAALEGGLPTDYVAQCAKLCQLWHLGVVLDYAVTDFAHTPYARQGIKIEQAKANKADQELREMIFDAPDGSMRMPLNLDEVGALLDVIEFDERWMFQDDYHSHYPGERAQSALYRFLRQLIERFRADAGANVVLA